MNSVKIIPKWILVPCAVFWVLSAIAYGGSLLDGSASMFMVFLPLTFLAAVILTLIVAILFIQNLSRRNPTNDDYTHGRVAKTIGALTLATIVFGFYATVKSLLFDPADSNFSDRFIYENISAGFWLACLVLTTILSAIQKDLYWVSRKKTIALDERQLHERRAVFETSYKIGFFIIFWGAIFLNYALGSLPTIIANNGGTVPGHVAYIGLYFVLMLFALPLLLAAWKRK